MSKKRILITGATGFIGRFLLQQSMSSGYDCSAFTRNPDAILSSILDPDKIVVGPLEKKIENLEVFKDVSCVIHCAARVHQMRETTSDTLSEYMLVNRDLTIALAKASISAGVKQFIFFSSIKVMGGEGRSNYILNENDIPHPTDPYGQSKFEAEQGLQALFKNQIKSRCTILRLPMVYGEGNKGNMLGLLKAAKKRIPLPIKSATGKRSMVYVGNISEAVLRILSHTPPGAEQVETFFLTDGRDYSSAELYSAIYRASNIGAEGVLYVPSVMFKIPSLFSKRIKKIASRLFDGYACSSELFQKTYSWRPPYTLEQGVERLVKWYKSL